jgi:hypothetical protein
MDSFLKKRKPVVLRQSFDSLLESQKPMVLRQEFGSRNIERFNSTAIDDSDVISNSDEIIIPPLNTDIRFSEVLPEHDPRMESGPKFINDHPKRPHVHERDEENFSWSIITPDDNAEMVLKKRLINPIQNQHMCGSCWAQALAACMSDCFVVSGVVSWMPKIAPTYLMMIIPERNGNGQCEGGNPASAALALESIPVCDTSCIDYSWCTNDSQLCTSANAANHFRSTFGERLNSNIPKPAIDGGGACYFVGDKYIYEIDGGSDVFFINGDVPTETFRKMVKAHIVDFGPPIAGYAVLKNFVTGNFTDPAVNQGVYFDRADYSATRPGQPLVFSDSNASEAQLSGLHAVRVLGWGVARNVQYDTDKFGDVPFWYAANSWGSGWGNMDGAFKIAMYPFNKFAQFDTQIRVRGFPVGGFILVRCTKPPMIQTQKQIGTRYLNSIQRIQPDSYYRMTPDEIVRGSQPESTQVDSSIWIYVVVAVSIIVVLVLLFGKKR